MADVGYDSKVPSFSTEDELVALLHEADEGGEDIVMTNSEWQRLRDDCERDAALRRKAS